MWIFLKLVIPWFSKNWGEINHFKVNSSEAFSAITVLCNHHLYLVPEHFVTPKENHAPLKKSLASPFPVPGNCHLGSVSMDLPILDILYKWNHIMYDLFCLASFTQHNACKVFIECVISDRVISFLSVFIFQKFLVITTYYLKELENQLVKFHRILCFDSKYSALSKLIWGESIYLQYWIFPSRNMVCISIYLGLVLCPSVKFYSVPCMSYHFCMCFVSDVNGFFLNTALLR